MSRAPAALRLCAYKWTKILAEVLKTRVPYDDELHLRDLVHNSTQWALDLDSRTKTEEAA